MLCVVVRIVGAMWLISSYVTRGTTIDATHRGMQGFTLSLVTCTHGIGVCCWRFIVG